MTRKYLDPKIDRVRNSLLEGLSRICLSLALGHFLCLPPLYLMLGRATDVRLVSRCITAITLSGVLLTLVAFLCRYQRIRGWLSYFCLGLLFVQSSYFLAHGRDFSHPLTMLFPLLCSLATPILGRRASYVMAALSSILFTGFYLFLFGRPHAQLPALALVQLVLFFSAYMTEVLWDGMLRRETTLALALGELRRKNDEMELWVKRLGEASSHISAGRLATELPEPPPSRVFRELTKSMGQMQEKLNSYFSDLLLGDRLRSLGVLASGVAHELNTPLTTMQFLLSGENGIPEETRQLLQMEVERMSAIAKGLLTFARPKSEEVVDLNEVVRITQKLFIRPNPGSEVSTQITLHPQPLLVRGARNQIQQILLNLFHNAADACEGRRTPGVWISTSERKEGTAVLSLRDNGCGIEPKLLSKILDPFFTTKPPGKGTGLGLFIVHQIVQRHDAVLQIESQQGQGTNVSIVFPRIVGETGAASPEEKKVA